MGKLTQFLNAGDPMEDYLTDREGIDDTPEKQLRAIIWGVQGLSENGKLDTLYSHFKDTNPEAARWIEALINLALEVPNIGLPNTKVGADEYHSSI